MTFNAGYDVGVRAGPTYSEECPKCHHGESWSVWVGVQGHLMGTCHRATCGHTAALDGSFVLAPKKKEPRYFTRPIKPLSPEQTTLIHKKFGLRPSEFEGYSYWDDRFILGVYGPEGYNRRGVIAYSFNAVPKTLTYIEKPEEPFVHYAGLPIPGADLVIVEDWFSAEKVGATGVAMGVAIFGTYLEQAKVSEIAAVANKRGARTWLALDMDAYPKSIGYLAKFREQFALGLGVWRLKKDLKYETNKRITEAVVSGKNDFFREDSTGGDVEPTGDL